MELEKTKVINRYTLIVFCVYLILALFALNTTGYCEGDDGAMVMYHAMGRNVNIQPVYSPYHSMFDTMLSVLPANESYVRKVGILLCFLSSFCSVVLLGYLLKLKKIKHWYLFFTIPLIIVEFLFSGLYINPTIVSFNFLLLAHISVLYFKKDYSKILWSAICFGLATSIRWNCGFYILIPIAEFIILKYSNIKEFFKFDSIIKSLIFFIANIFFLFLFIYISGYSPYEIYDVYKSGTKYIDGKELSKLSLIASAITHLTPSYIILLLISIFFSIKKKRFGELFLIIVAILPFTLTGLFVAFKMMITVIPVTMILIFSTNELLNNTFLKYLVLSTIIIPFILGIEVYSNSAWGPSFEIKGYSFVQKEYNSYENFNPDKSISNVKVMPTLKSGCAMPTPEGPRPLWGFLYVLIKDWSTVIDDINLGRENAVNYAVENNVDILQDVNHSFLSTKLLEKYYKTSERFNDEKLSRIFIRNNDSITIFRPKNKILLFEDNYINTFFKGDEEEIIVYSTYTNIVNKLDKKYKGMFVKKGAYWGVLKKMINE